VPHDETDTVVRNSRREAIIIGLMWLASTLYCCFYSWWFGYGSSDHPLTRKDVNPTLGIPSWAFWGYIVPWAVCALFTIWFAGFYMVDDDLGRDHAAELEGDIREGGLGDGQG
jgi:hypothetical protein